MKEALRGYCMTRIESLRSYRLSWWVHWAQLAEFYLPRRYRWFVQPNTYNRGSPINGQIVDETGLKAARTLATGLLANLTSPTKPWFRLGLRGIEDVPEGPIKVWLAECTRRMLTVYAGSNLYQVLGQSYHDNCVFGSAAIIQYEDPQTVVRFYGPCLGEFFFGLSNRLTVDTLFREYTYTTQQTVEEFGEENIPESIRAVWKSPANKDMEVVIGHAIEPNELLYQSGEAVGYVVPKRFKFREVYWGSYAAAGQRNGFILRVGGFMERPHVGLRWDVTSNDPYGRSPGMDGLPANRQLQIEQRRKAEAIDKMVRPPMVASVSMKNEPMDILPGGVSYVADPQGSGFKPAFTVEPRIAEMMEDLKEVQARLEDIFFVPLFKAFPTDTVRTATEAQYIRDEQLLLLGPVIERTENEGLDEIIERTFAIMARRGMFPPAPAEIQGAAISIQYISILAEAQRAASTAAIERIWQFAGGLAGVVPNILDNLDGDISIDRYADLLNVDPEIVRTVAKVAFIRQQRAQQEAQQQALASGQALAEGAQTLSKAAVGGGKTALQAMLGQAA